ncbi:MAG: pyridoxal-phosphate dependent enzyme [Crocinitomix sp.]|nr:pyridoxal-phosphate dependent enzyme [Crocinitomix sp.]
MIEEITKMIHLAKLDQDLYAKIEFENPVAAMKYRAIPAFIAQLIDSGEVKPGSSIAMRSAGSAAVAMARTAILKGVHPIAVLPPSAPPNIVRLLKWIGAEVHLVPPNDAKVLIQQYQTSDQVYVFGQAGETHLIDLYKPVGEEIAAQLPNVAAVTVGIGTGISITGIALALKEANPDIAIYGCEPQEAPIASGGKWAPHNIPGLAPPIPQPLLDKSLLAGIVTVASAEAWSQAKNLSKTFGILAGPSSGCTISAALQLREQGVKGPIVAVLACGILEYLVDE